jgi:hypothetical protein
MQPMDELLRRVVADLAALRARHALVGALQVAEQSLGRIMQLGSNRGRDLPASFARLRAELAP